MKVLIIGGGGYIGSVLTDYLLSKNHKIIVLDSLRKGSKGVLPFKENPNYTFLNADFTTAILPLILKTYYPEITFHYIISKENINEVLPFISLVKKIMGKELTSIYFTAILHPFPEIKDIVVDVPDNLVRKANDKCQRLGIKVAWNRNVPGEKDSIKKCNEWTMPFIFVDGTVVPCCAGNEANKRPYQRKTGMGNIFKTPFKEIWNSPQYKALRKTIHEGKIPAACKYCTIYKV